MIENACQSKGGAVPHSMRRLLCGCDGTVQWPTSPDGKWELFKFANNTLLGLELTADELKRVECATLPNDWSVVNEHLR